MDILQVLSLEEDTFTIPEGVEISTEARTTVTGNLNEYRSLKYLDGYDFDDKYYANKEGDVISVKYIKGNFITGILMSPYINRDHYVEYVLVDKNKKLKHINGHRIVAGLYLPIQSGKDKVNHKDGNRQNNHVRNLEWVSHSENIYHSWNSIRKDPNKHKFVRRLPGQPVKRVINN